MNFVQTFDTRICSTHLMPREEVHLSLIFHQVFYGIFYAHFRCDECQNFKAHDTHHSAFKADPNAITIYLTQRNISYHHQYMFEHIRQSIKVFQSYAHFAVLQSDIAVLRWRCPNFKENPFKFIQSPLVYKQHLSEMKRLV